jgi:hypothetical protein
MLPTTWIPTIARMRTGAPLPDAKPLANTFAILRLDNGVEPIMIQRVSKNAHRLKLAQGFVGRFLNIFPCVFNSLCG